MIGEMSFQYFELLLTEVEKAFKVSYPACNSDIRNWNIKEIALFQNDLSDKVNGRISERWFYTHIKTRNNSKLPRMDVLNMLSQYTGFADWEEFVQKNTAKSTTDDTPDFQDTIEVNKGNKSKVGIWGLILICFLTIVGTMMYYINNETVSAAKEEQYQLCFMDADTRKNIKNVEIELIKPGESPQIIKADTTGCLNFMKSEGNIRFIVKAPYYKKDTIIRNVSTATNRETILLKTDDYGLMIHLFSKSKVQDWEKRRQQLDEMISNDAIIFQVYEKTQKGMELYDKTSFIDKLTMPLESLNNIKIIEIEYQNGKIAQMRFTETENKD